MPDIALLTEARYENPPEKDRDWYAENILAEDALVAEGLAKRGLSCVRVDWARPDFDWSSVRAAVFRTTWDYFFRAAEFSAWLDRVSTQTRLVNSVEMVRRNMDKHYLADVEGRGVRIVPTHFLEQGSAATLAATLSALGWDQAVLKPAVSGAARHTYRVSPESAASHEAIMAKLLSEEAMMLQPFQRAIVEEGELTLVVIGGRCTHAVRKVAKAGDFRVQDDHGGTVHPHQASAEEIDFAQRAVEACDSLPAYARVDVIRDNAGQLALMELEMIEPELFFRFEPAAADAFAEHLSQLLRA